MKIQKSLENTKNKLFIFNKKDLPIFLIKNSETFITKNVLSLPGVPSILISMIENCKKYLVKGLNVHSKSINLYTVESNISKKLGLIQKKHKKFVEIGSYPFFRLGKIGVSIVSRSTSKKELKRVSKDILKLIKLKKIEVLKI